MSNALLYLGGILAAVLALLFAVPYFVDWNSYRGVFEEEASRVLGREVRVGGGVNLRLLPAPYVSFEKIRIADSSADAGTSFFRAESFTMWLSVPPLLRGVIEANQIELKHPVVQLAIDRDGTGNWRTLSLSPGAMAFAPRDVALQSVNISDGELVLAAAGRGELARFDSINGELAADALEGPFRFRGGLEWGGRRRDVRIVTAPRAPNGDIRFKAAVDALDTADSYVLDGRLSDLAGAPRIDGDLTAKLDASLLGGGPREAAPARRMADGAPPAGTAALPAVPQDAKPANPEAPLAAPGPANPGGPAAPAVAAAPSVANDRPPQFDLRAKVSGGSSGLDLTDIAITMDQGGPPQLITGAAKMVWAERMHLDVALTSPWLDLDRFAGSGSTAIPLVAARSLFATFASALPAEADTNATLKFDQVFLGGETVSDVRLAATRDNGPLELKGVRASLPGGTRLELEGVLQPSEKAPKFDGTLWLSGQSLMRFLAWGLRDKTVGADRTDGPFSLEGRLALSDDAIDLTDGRADLSGVQLAGDARLGLGERKRLALTLEGARLDASQIKPGIVGLGSLDQVLFKTESDPPKEGEAKADLFDPASTDLALKLSFGEVVDGSRTLRDLRAEMSVDRGTMSMPVLKFTTPEGLHIEADGDAVGIPAAPKGAVRALVAAPTAEAASALLDLLEIPEQDMPRAFSLPALAPLRVAVSLDFRGRSDHSTDLTIDGLVQGSRVRATLRMDGGREGWRTQPLDFTAVADSLDVDRLLASVDEGAAGARPASSSSKPSRVVVKAAGIPANGIVSLATIAADGLAVDYNGSVKLVASSPAEATGTLRVSATDARPVLALAGLRLAEGAAGVPLRGEIALTKGAKDMILTASGLSVGGSKVSGKLTLKETASGGRAIDADLAVDTATVAGILAPFLGAAYTAIELPPPQLSQGKATAPLPPVEASAIWPEHPFDFTSLGKTEASVKVRFASLALEPGLTIADANVSASVDERGIEMQSLAGDAIGGKLTSGARIAKAAAGVTMEGSLRLNIAGVAPGADPVSDRPADAVAFSVDFAGRGLSPGALVSDLSGKGVIAIGDAALTGMSPAAVKGVIQNALAGKGPIAGDALVEAVKAAVKQGEFKIGRIKVPVAIADGAMTLEKVKIESPDGRATFTTVVELNTMKLDSEWQIEPKLARNRGAGQDRVYLPPVSIVYVGKLSELATMEPRVVTGALERELQVRKMEQDVDELERLRKLDQTRAAPPPPQSAAPPPPQSAIAPAARAPQNGVRAPPPAVQEGALPDDAGAPAEAPTAASASTAPPLPAATTIPDRPPVAGIPVESTPPPGDVPQNGATAANALPVDAAVQPTVPEQPRPARRRKPANEEWRPFQTSPF